MVCRAGNRRVADVRISLAHLLVTIAVVLITTVWRSPPPVLSRWLLALPPPCRCHRPPAVPLPEPGQPASGWPGETSPPCREVLLPRQRHAPCAPRRPQARPGCQAGGGGTSGRPARPAAPARGASAPLGGGPCTAALNRKPHSPLPCRGAPTAAERRRLLAEAKAASAQDPGGQALASSSKPGLRKQALGGVQDPGAPGWASGGSSPAPKCRAARRFGLEL